ncbi:RCC1 domain-containing protein, partial [Flaviflexus sp.]|uniref:RCC1 domain-containing protein n=1 Tax=Flaviflexus sp. TaxID=1969482 RepID=UPI003F929F5C
MISVGKSGPVLAAFLGSLLLFFTGISPSSAVPAPDHGPANTATEVTLNKPGLGNIKQISAGYDYTVALSQDGTAYSWGANSYGQLGDGTLTDSADPRLVDQPAGVKFTDVSAGLNHVLALGSDGKVYAWGDNTFGQLGNGTDTASRVPTVVKQPKGVTFTYVSAGYDYSLALGDNGKAYAWGSNFFGKLGTGSWDDQGTPVLIDQPKGVTLTQVSAGYDHSVALGDDGNAYAWGANQSSQLGDGTSEDSYSPVLVKQPAGVKLTQIGSGYEYSVALGDDGNAYTWGIIFYRGSDDSMSSVSSATPKMVDMPRGVSLSEISAGANHVLAHSDDGSSYGWGNNEFGQVGGGSTVPFVSTPELVDQTGDVSFLQISAGGFHSVAVGDDGNTYAWGDNEYGQLGLREGTVRPQRIEWDIEVTDVSFDGVKGTNLTDKNDGTISVLTPALPDGIVDVSVSWTLNGVVQDPVVYVDGFTFGTPPPPSPKGNVFYLLNDWESTTHDLAFAYGRFGDEVFVGDWDGDGYDTLAVRRGINFYANNSLRGGNADAE